MAALLAMSTLGFAGYALLLPLAPLWAVHGGADESGAGLVNAVLMGATVVGQLGVHPAIRRLGWAPVLCAGVLALGLPALLLPLSDALPAVLAVSALRGIGFAVLTVGGSSAVAELVPPSVRGRAVGLYGLSIALPQMVLVPLGPTLTAVLPIGVVALLGALPVLAVPPALRLGRLITAGTAAEPAAEFSAHPTAESDGPLRASPGPAAPDSRTVGSLPAPSRRRALLLLALPSLSLLAITAPGGALLSFTPQLAPDLRTGAIALFAFTATTTLSRWLLGHAADRVGPFGLIAPLLLVGAAGLGLAALGAAGASPAGDSGALIAGMALAGIAYGGVQNVTLVAAFALVPRQRDLASTVWNIGFDVGTGIGSLAVGAIAAAASFPEGLGWAAALALLGAAANLLRSLVLPRLRSSP
ncbi:MFS transporter [Brachybacterium hainanense]|uniref:MFS transporter n=1 Tax=Brachybacterium hainanense TaxID=1541174 RepID=A0ABV6R884_9MICO